MTEPTMDNKVIFQQDTPDGMEEVIRFDKEGFHYRDQFIADAGEAHRLMVEFLRQNTQPEQQGQTDEDLCKTLHQAICNFPPTHPSARDLDSHQYEIALEIRKARAVLARWGRSAIEPVPVAERLPRPEDCDAEGQCWWWHPDHKDEEFGDGWILLKSEWAWGRHDADHSLIYTHWLPHHALPVPQQETDRG